MKQTVRVTTAIIAIAISTSLAFAGEKNYKVEYVGGSLSLKAGTSMKLYVRNDHIQLCRGNDVVVSIPTASVLITSGSDFRPITATGVGLAMVTLGWSSVYMMGRNKDYYVSFAWTENGKRRIVGVDTGAGYRQLMVDLEAAAAKTIQ